MVFWLTMHGSKYYSAAIANGHYCYYYDIPYASTRLQGRHKERKNRIIADRDDSRILQLSAAVLNSNSCKFLGIINMSNINSVPIGLHTKS